MVAPVQYDDKKLIMSVKQPRAWRLNAQRHVNSTGNWNAYWGPSKLVSVEYQAQVSMINKPKPGKGKGKGIFVNVGGQTGKDYRSRCVVAQTMCCWWICGNLLDDYDFPARPPPPPPPPSDMGRQCDESLIVGDRTRNLSLRKCCTYIPARLHHMTHTRAPGRSTAFCLLFVCLLICLTKIAK